MVDWPWIPKAGAELINNKIFKRKLLQQTRQKIKPHKHF